MEVSMFFYFKYYKYILLITTAATVLLLPFNDQTFAKEGGDGGPQKVEAPKENIQPAVPIEQPKPVDVQPKIEMPKPAEMPDQNRRNERREMHDVKSPDKDLPAVPEIIKEVESKPAEKPVIVPPAPIIPQENKVDVPAKTIEVKKPEDKKDKFDRREGRQDMRQKHHENMGKHMRERGRERDHDMPILKVLPDILLSITPGFEEQDRVIVQQNKERYFSHDIREFKKKITNARKTKVLVLYGDEFLLNIRLEMMMGIAGLQLTVLNPTELTFERLSQLTNLRSLTIVGDNMYDEYLEYLLPLRNLRILNIEKTSGFTERGLNAFWNDMPRLRIVW